MLVDTFTATFITACALLAYPILGNPIDILPEGLESHLQSRAEDFTVRFWKQTTCKTSRSEKTFKSGHCIKALAGKDHAVSMKSRKNTNCHMIRYREKNCKGYAEKGLNLYDCFNIGDEWESLKFQC